jgi:hypothetical protein
VSFVADGLLPIQFVAAAAAALAPLFTLFTVHCTIFSLYTLPSEMVTRLHVTILSLKNEPVYLFCAMQFTFLLDDVGVPANYRHMEGFGVHTFMLLNKAGRETLVKFHWKPTCGEWLGRIGLDGLLIEIRFTGSSAVVKHGRVLMWRCS